MAPLLEVANLVKHFRARNSRVYAVNDVSFVLEAGETLGLVGESGSGKTTVGRCILRTVEPTSGEIIYGGLDILKLSARGFRRMRPQLQMVFQDPFDSLNPRLLVGDLIREPLRRSELSRRDQGERVLELARKVGLQREYIERLPHELSAGQQQRVGIARAIAMNPKLIILDEAVANLDASNRFEIIELLRTLQRDLGLSYIFISHDLETVRHASDRVAVLYLGKIVEIASAVELFDRQLHPYTRALLSAVLVPDPRVKLSRYVLSGELPSPTRLPPGCFLESRCPEAQPGCRLLYPPMITDASGRTAACFLLDPSTFPDATDASGGSQEAHAVRGPA